MEECKKCGGSGAYQYDDRHTKLCEACCTHPEGWWELTEHYVSYQKGADNRCCQRGCGTMARDLPPSQEVSE